MGMGALTPSPESASGGPHDGPPSQNATQELPTGKIGPTDQKVTHNTRSLQLARNAGKAIPPLTLLMPVAILAVILFAVFTYKDAQAQQQRGAVTGITLSSDAAGNLTATWDTPAPAPTDYRLMWAAVSEDYLSSKDANETDRGSSYPSGSAT